MRLCADVVCAAPSFAVMKKYSVLLADLDNTLLDFTASERSALGRLFGHFGIECGEDVFSDYASFNVGLWERLERGELTRKQLIDTRFVEFFRHENIDADGHAAKTLYERFLTEGAFKTDGADELFERCRGKIRIYIISNGTMAVQLPRLAASGFDRLSDGCFISEMVGYNKPDRRFFEYVRDNVPGFNKEETLVLGDSLTADIDGGARFGLDTCLFDRNGSYDGSGAVRPDMVIDRLTDIFGILGV